MRVPRNAPRSHAKRAAWEAQQQRRERCGLSTAPVAAPVVSRSLSLRATSFIESRPGHSEFPQPRTKSAPKPKTVKPRKPSKRERKLLDQMLASGDTFLQVIASRS